MLLVRGIDSSQQGQAIFKPSLGDLHDPALLPGAVTAAKRIADALNANERIVIYGDYDVDGVTAIAILYHTLKTAKPDTNVHWYIPHRIDEGYGINDEALTTLIDEGAKLIISVDCGITAVEPVALAKEKGVDLIITDHHEFSDQLPQACAVVHPRLHEVADTDGVVYPFADLCGAGVAYKLAWQVARTLCGSERVSEQFKKLLVDMLPLAALGTVADVVPLTGENRTITYFGLGHIKRTPLHGLNTLIDVSNLRNEKIDSYHIGFILGPRLNACGRMGHARRACELLTTAEGDKAIEIARFLNTENENRRAIQKEIFEQACEIIDEEGFDNDDVRAIVLGDDEWHQGVVGVVCSKLVERYGRPTVLLNTGESLARGSARSIDGFNIYEAFAACAEHLESFGGHAMAAGLKLQADNVDAFGDALEAYALSHITVEELTPLLKLDAEATFADVTVEMIEQLERLAPFGRNNYRPGFLIRDVEITQKPGQLGQGGKHVVLIARQGGCTLRCIGWSMRDLLPDLQVGMHIDMAVSPMINCWRGMKKPELELLDLRVL